MRVLHLVQPLSAHTPWFSFGRVNGHTGGEGGLLAIRALMHECAIGGWQDDRHIVCIIGGSANRSFARLSGLEQCHFISPPLGDAGRAAPGLRAILHRCGPLDGVVCWGTGLRAIARKVAGAAPAWAEVDMQSGEVFPFDARLGTPGASVGPAFPRHDGSSVSEPSRSHVRADLGVSSDERVVAMLTDSANPGFAPTLLGSAAMLHVAGMPCTYVFPRECDGLYRVGRSVREGTYISRAIISTMPASASALGADVAVCVPGETDSGGASLAWITHRVISNGGRVIAPQRWIDSWGTGMGLLPAGAGLSPDIARVLLGLFNATPTPPAPPPPPRNAGGRRHHGLRATLLAAISNANAPEPAVAP